MPRKTTKLFSTNANASTDQLSSLFVRPIPLFYYIIHHIHSPRPKKKNYKSRQIPKLIYVEYQAQQCQAMLCHAMPCYALNPPCNVVKKKVLNYVEKPLYQYFLYLHSFSSLPSPIISQLCIFLLDNLYNLRFYSLKFTINNLLKANLLLLNGCVFPINSSGCNETFDREEVFLCFLYQYSNPMIQQS